MKLQVAVLAAVCWMAADGLAASSSFGGRSAGGFSSSRSSFSSSRSSSSGSFGGRSASSSRSSGSSWFSSSKPASSSKPTAIKVDRSAYLSGLSQRGATGADAGALYKSFRANQNTTANGGRFKPEEIVSRFKPEYRQQRRAEYYGGYAPRYGSHYQESMATHSSGFGMWDYLLFNSILDNMGDRQMYYHHQDDPGFKSWRTEADKACAAGDKDVCAKLAGLDKEMAEYKAKGVPVDPSYLTPGVDPDIYEAAQIDMSKLPALKVCTGAAGADYDRYLAEIGKLTKLKTVRVASNGSVDNLHKIGTGECDLAFAQDDMLPDEHITRLATLDKMEVGFLLCPTASKVTTAAELSDQQTVFIGSDQTGSQFTFDRLKQAVPALQKVKTHTTLTAMAAVGHILNDDNSCFFAVSRPNYQGFLDLDQSARFIGIPIYSWDFKDRNTARFTLVTVDKKYYKNLTQEKNTGCGTSDGTDSIGIKTSLFASAAWIAQNKDLYNLLLMERAKLQGALN